MAYSDELTFENSSAKRIALRSLGTITKRSRKPRSVSVLEKKVVSHAMGHIAFFIKTDDQIVFKSAMTPETLETFEKLWVRSL